MNFSLSHQPHEYMKKGGDEPNCLWYTIRYYGTIYLHLLWSNIRYQKIVIFSIKCQLTLRARERAQATMHEWFGMNGWNMCEESILFTTIHEWRNNQILIGRAWKISFTTLSTLCSNNSVTPRDYLSTYYSNSLTNLGLTDWHKIAVLQFFTTGS